MRKIQIEFEIPEEYEEDYAGTSTEYIVEDFIQQYVPNIGFKIISDTTTSEEE